MILEIDYIHVNKEIKKKTTLYPWCKLYWIFKCIGIRYDLNQIERYCSTLNPTGSGDGGVVKLLACGERRPTNTANMTPILYNYNTKYTTKWKPSVAWYDVTVIGTMKICSVLVKFSIVDWGSDLMA